MLHQVVIRYKAGDVRRGTTADFKPNGDSFTLAEEGPGGARRDTTVAVEELKAIFFVRSLQGNREYSEKKLQAPVNPVGKRLLVTFRDGESLRGTTHGTNLTQHGFLFFPADPRSNNKRIFVVRSAVALIREEGGGSC